MHQGAHNGQITLLKEENEFTDLEVRFNAKPYGETEYEQRERHHREILEQSAGYCEALLAQQLGHQGALLAQQAWMYSILNNCNIL